MADGSNLPYHNAETEKIAAEREAALNAPVEKEEEPEGHAEKAAIRSRDWLGLFSLDDWRLLVRDRHWLDVSTGEFGFVSTVSRILCAGGMEHAPH